MDSLIMDRMQDWLEHELHFYPDQASGNKLYAYSKERLAGVLEYDRVGFVAALREWIWLESEPRTLLAVHLAAEFRLTELRTDLHALLERFESGQAFHPSLRTLFAKQIHESLSRIWSQAEY
jgi:hypothetical protein